MVSMRSVMVAANLMVAIGISGYLLYQEDVAPPEVTASHVVLKVDPLLQVRYTESNRKQNLKVFGLPDRLAKAALDRMRRIEMQHERKIEILLNGAADPNALADALCGETAQVRPRYGALRFLVKEKQSRRDPIRISSVTGLEVAEWALVAPIGDVYAEAELSDKRQEDATLMALAAILEGSEEDLLEGYKPWGRGILPGAWSWDGVMKKHPGVGERVVEYIAVMHLFVEKANADGGICGEEDE